MPHDWVVQVIVWTVSVAGAFGVWRWQQRSDDKFQAMCARRGWTYRDSAPFKSLGLARFKPPAGDPGPVIQGKVNDSSFQIVQFTLRRETGMYDKRGEQIFDEIGATLHVIDLPTDPTIRSRLKLPAGWRPVDDAASLVVQGGFQRRRAVRRIDEIGAAIATAIDPPWQPYPVPKPGSTPSLPVGTEPVGTLGTDELTQWKAYPGGDPEPRA